jgi:hypothetical protein
MNEDKVKINFNASALHWQVFYFAVAKQLRISLKSRGQMKDDAAICQTRDLTRQSRILILPKHMSFYIFLIGEHLYES